MQLKRWGANRNSGTTSIFNKKGSMSWSASAEQLQVTIRNVSQGESGQYNFMLSLTLDDIKDMLSALSREATLPAVSEGMQTAMLDLFRLQAAAAGIGLPRR